LWPQIYLIYTKNYGLEALGEVDSTLELVSTLDAVLVHWLPPFHFLYSKQTTLASFPFSFQTRV
jgi:hypothetical protein